MRLTYEEKVSKEFGKIFCAYHEVGHIMLAILNNIPVDFVYIRDSKNGYHGEVNYKQSDIDLLSYNDDKIHLMKLEVSIYYAGICTEKLLYQKLSGTNTLLKYFSEGSSHDIKIARTMITDNNLYKDLKKCKQIYYKYITKMLNDHWDDIILLSYQILKFKRLDHNKIKKILTIKSKNKSFWIDKFTILDKVNKTKFSDSVFSFAYKKLNPII
jgi:hypothetical protein